MVAVALVELHAASLRPEDLSLLERLLRASRTWALVDGSAASVIGTLVERSPELGLVLDRWAADHDFWIRRSALLALLPGGRRGAGDFGRFCRYADLMLGEKSSSSARQSVGCFERPLGSAPRSCSIKDLSVIP
jgi:hypothetical protein